MKVGSMLALAVACLAVGPGSAKADDQQHQQDQQGQQACMTDAMLVCSQFIPDRARVAGCLISNRDRISAPCRAQLAHWRS